MVPLYLLPLVTHLVISTILCLVEVWNTEDWSRDDINKNVPGYVGFLIICMSPLPSIYFPLVSYSKLTNGDFSSAIIMWVDMFSRLKTSLTEKAKVN